MRPAPSTSSTTMIAYSATEPGDPCTDASASSSERRCWLCRLRWLGSRPSAAASRPCRPAAASSSGCSSGPMLLPAGLCCPAGAGSDDSRCCCSFCVARAARRRRTNRVRNSGCGRCWAAGVALSQQLLKARPNAAVFTVVWVFLECTAGGAPQTVAPPAVSPGRVAAAVRRASHKGPSNKSICCRNRTLSRSSSRSDHPSDHHCCSPSEHACTPLLSHATGPFHHITGSASCPSPGTAAPCRTRPPSLTGPRNAQ